MLATLLAIIAISDTPDLDHKKHIFDIPAGEPRITLMQWMRVVDVHGGFDPELFAKLRTHNIKGIFTACEALRQMIAGTPIIVVGEKGAAACKEIPLPAGVDVP